MYVKNWSISSSMPISHINTLAACQLLDDLQFLLWALLKIPSIGCQQKQKCLLFCEVGPSMVLHKIQDGS
jgi:hypothetical protein